jgi:hypothetical protein
MLKDLHNRLRPLGIADILDETVEIYKSNFVLLVGIAAFLYVPYSLLSAGLQSPRFDMEKMEPAQFVGLFLTLLVSFVFYVIAAPIVTGALTYGISERYLDRPTSIGACYRRMLSASVFLRFLGANALVFLAGLGALLVPGIFIGAGVALLVAGMGSGSMPIILGILLIVVGIPAIIIPIYVMLRLTLVAPAFVIEMRGAVGSLGRSWDLMKGNMLKALALLAIVSVVVSIIQGIIASPVAIAIGLGAVKGADPSYFLLVINTVLQAILSTVLAPLTSIVVMLLYYDMRIRKEGFDLELLARDLAAGAEAYGAYGASSLPQEQPLPPPHYAEETTKEGTEQA